MTKTLDAVYKNGALHPLEPVHLSEQQKVRLTISAGGPTAGEDWVDTEFMDRCSIEADESVTLEQVQQALVKIPGSITEDFIAERNER